MIGKVLVDGVDIYATYGVFIVDGGLCGLLSYPPLKQPDTIDWKERDGIEVDLSNPELDTRQFSIEFASVGNMEGFLSIFNTGGYHVFEFPLLWMHKKLRVVSVPKYEMNLIKSVSFEFADDYPIESRNLVPNPIVGVETNEYGFGTREVLMTGGKKYILSANGNSINAANGKQLRVFIYSSDWTFQSSISITEKFNKTKIAYFTAPYTGHFGISGYYFDGSQPRTGSVRLNWYKLEEVGLQNYEYKAPENLLVPAQNCSLGSSDLSHYGIQLLEGCRNEILKIPAVKQNLTKNVKSISGAIYDPERVKYQSKEVKLKLLISHWSVKRLMSNYLAFLYDLKKSGYKTLVYEGKSYQCYYKSGQVSKTHFGRTISFEFEVNLVFTKLGV